MAHHAKGAGMEEQPHEGPAEQPTKASDDQPKFFKSMNGMIAGATGLVIALGGLATAYKTMTGDKPTAQQAAPSPPSEAAVEPKQQQSEQRPTLYKGDLYVENGDDGAFNGGSMRLEREGVNWVLTAGDEKYEYSELESNDKSRIFASSNVYTSTLRWPVTGGEVEESTAVKRDKWHTYAKVEPATSTPAE
jgi:hypothetical protein